MSANTTNWVGSPNAPELPDEIVEYHIFKYFPFSIWLAKFQPVCKQWKRICKNSKSTTKHLIFANRKNFDLGLAIIIVKKYQPQMITINNFWASEPVCALPRIVPHSKKLDTLIIDHFETPQEMDMKIVNITTLVIHRLSVPLSTVFKTFRKVKRMQLTGVKLANEDYAWINKLLPELTIFESPTFNMGRITIPKLTVVDDGEIFIFNNGVRKELDPMEDLTYEEYYRYLGYTKLYKELEDYHFVSAAKYLENETNLDYERKLLSFVPYQYPTKIMRNSFPLKWYYERIAEGYRCHAEGHSLLMKFGTVTITPEDEFKALINQNKIEEAFKAIQNNDLPLSLAQRFLESNLFREKVPIELFKQPKIIDLVRQLLKQRETLLNITSVTLLERVSFAIDDWSKVPLFSSGDDDLYFALVDKGVQMNVYDLGITAQYKDISSKIDGLRQRGIEVDLYELLKKCPFVKLSNVSKSNIDVTMEKNGISVFNQWMASQSSTINPEITKYLHLINHMDGSGTTPLGIYIKDKKIELTKQLLKYGADPNKPQGNHLTPLALLLTTFPFEKKNSVEFYDFLKVLLKAGADINAPCLFEQRMCSPLMIAVRKKLDVQVIHLLLALRARTDYRDETGQTIYECDTDKLYGNCLRG